MEMEKVWVKRELDADGVTKVIHATSKTAMIFSELLEVPIECGLDHEKIRVYLNRKWLRENK